MHNFTKKLILYTVFVRFVKLHPARKPNFLTFFKIHSVISCKTETLLLRAYHERERLGEINCDGNGGGQERQRQAEDEMDGRNQIHNEQITEGVVWCNNGQRGVEEVGHGGHQRAFATWRDKVTRYQRWGWNADLIPPFFPSAVLEM